MGTPSLPSSSAEQGRSDGLDYRGLGAGRTQQSQSNEQEIQGAVLYRSFLSEEFRRLNLPEPGQVLNQHSVFHSIPDPSEPHLARYANQLRMVTQEFYSSPVRSLIDEQAARVPINQLDMSTFTDLLYGLFQEGGVTSQRIVVLYYFCTNLAIRAFRENLSTELNNIVDWSITFFRGEAMLRWVVDNGGWANVLRNSAVQLWNSFRDGFLILGIMALASYIWRTRL